MGAFVTVTVRDGVSLVSVGSPPVNALNGQVIDEPGGAMTAAHT